jgi:N-methylhydantoinase A
MVEPVEGTFVVGVDIGGTCTDCVVIDPQGTATVAKAFSTPPDFGQGIVDALGVAAAELGLDPGALLRSTRLFLHSTTVAENAIVDETLAAAGIVTTRGFRSTLFATRGGFGRYAGLTEDEKRNPTETVKPPPLVPVANIATIGERVDRAGEVVVALDDAEAEQALGELLARDVDALGVCLLWSFTSLHRSSASTSARQRSR